MLWINLQGYSGWRRNRKGGQRSNGNHAAGIVTDKRRWMRMLCGEKEAGQLRQEQHRQGRGAVGGVDILSWLEGEGEIIKRRLSKGARGVARLSNTC